MDATEAWARAIEAGMNRNARFDFELVMVASRPIWRLSWVSGGQTYRVDTVTGFASLETGAP